MYNRSIDTNVTCNHTLFCSTVAYVGNMKTRNAVLKCQSVMSQTTLTCRYSWSVVTCFVASVLAMRSGTLKFVFWHSAVAVLYLLLCFPFEYSSVFGNIWQYAEYAL